MTVVVINIARGQRCRCYLHTAVSRELLAPVSRLRQARKFVAQLQPLIEAVQGPITAEHVVVEADAPEQPPEVLAPPGYAPELLFVLLLLDAALMLVDQRFPRVQVGNLLITTLVAEVVLAVVALVRKGPYARPLVHFLVILTLICVAWDLIGMMRSFGTSIAQVTDAVRHGNLVAYSFSWSPTRVEMLFAVAWRSVAGITGLSATYVERRMDASK